MKRTEKTDLFEMFSDPRPSGGSGGLGDGFRKFLEERGEYPFKEDAAGPAKGKRSFRVRGETMLIGSVVFMIVLIAVFSMGVWNGKQGEAAVPGEDGTKAAQKLPDVAPKVVTDPLPSPEPVSPAVAQPAVAGHETAAPVQSSTYMIRVASLPVGKTADAKAIAAFFESRGFKPTQVRAIGKNLVVEVGGFSSTANPQSQRALRDVQAAAFKGNKFQSAYFIRVKKD